MKKQLFTLLTLLVLCVTGVWAQTTLFYYNVSSSSQPDLTSFTATGGTLTLGITSGSDKFSSENGSSYVPSVPDDMKGYYNKKYYIWKSGKSAHFIQMTLSGTETFKAGDIIQVCCYNGWNVCLDNAGSSVVGDCTAASATSKENMEIASFTLPANFVATNTLYLKRKIGSGTGIAAIKVIRKTAATLSFAEASGTKDITSVTSFSLPAVTASPNVSAITDNITYTSSDESVATLDGTTVNILKTGTAIITANFAGDAAYTDASATYTLNVTNSTHSQFGYTEAIDGTTLLARSLSVGTLSNISTPTIALGSDIQNYAGTSKKVYIDNTEYSNTDTWYNSANNEYRYLGYDVTVSDGYVLNLSKLDARLAVGTEAQSIDYLWYVEILDKSNAVLYTSAVQTSNKTDDTSAAIADYMSLTNLTGTVHVRLYVKHNGTFKEFSINKLQLTGITAVDSRPSHTITFAAGEGTGTVPAAITTKDSEITLPGAPLLYKSGYSLKWKDASDNVYLVGDTYTITDDATLTAEFVANAANPWTAATTVKWTFQRNDGAPTINVQGTASSPVVYSKSVTIGENPYDALMTIDARHDNDAKFDNSTNSGYAQVNANVKFTIPAVYGMVVTYKYNQLPSAVSNATFAGNNADSYNTSARTLTYTYKGAASTIDIIEMAGNKYPEWISVEYPIVPASITAPTITKGDFNFANNGYKVTISKADDYGDLMVSTDGINYTEQTSPYVAYATATTHYYAKTTAGALASTVTDLNVTNTFDGEKKYIAWVYTKGYNGGNSKPSYAFATDPMVIALQAEFNVVEVDYTEDTTPSTDLKEADLIVCTEAMAGNKTMSNGLVSLLKNDGTGTPMIGLKMYNYGNGDDATKRWKWGLPANPSSTTLGFTPVATDYKVLAGVSFENDGTIKLATESFDTGSYKNVVQSANFTGANKPTDNAIMGRIGSDDTKVVMHYSALKKYFGLGLSSDCWATYTSNATAIVKNAAKMLIAGENIATTKLPEPGATTDNGSTVTVPVNASMAGWRSFYDATQNYTVAAETKVYYASSTNAGTSKVTLAEIDGCIPADVPVILFEDGATEITLTKTDADLTAYVPASNELTVSDGNAPLTNVYRLGYKASDGVGFYKYSSTGDAPAGIIYIAALDAGANFLGFDFGGTTGINAVESKKEQLNGEVYNLAGQRVAQPTKGLYIVNGRKVIIK